MWEDVLKSSVKQEIDEYIKDTKQGLYDMLLPTWEEDPQLLKKHIENKPVDGLLESINSNVIFAIKNFSKKKKPKNDKVDIVNKKIKKPILNKINKNESVGLLSELKKRNLKKSKKSNNGIILNIVNEDQNLQKKLIKINILNKRKRLNQKDWWCSKVYTLFIKRF